VEANEAVLGSGRRGDLHLAAGRMFVHTKFKVADCDPIKTLCRIVTPQL
jgi:hypothetical protein